MSLISICHDLALDYDRIVSVFRTVKDRDGVVKDVVKIQMRTGDIWWVNYEELSETIRLLLKI